MLSGTLPFGGSTNAEIFKNIKMGTLKFSGQAWNTVSEEAKDLINKMLVKDPN